MAASTGASSTSPILRGGDEAPLRAIQIRTFLLCALVMMLDGIDNQSIGVVAPLMSADLGFDKAQMGTIFSLTQVGATLGALLLGTVADRFGRRPTILFCVIVMSIFTLISALVPEFGLLLFIRFVAGLGLAGVFSSALALASEYAPTRLRGTVVSVVYAGYPAGAALGGVMAAVILAHHDWRMVLYAGALLGLVTFGLTVAWLPESIGFLLSRGSQAERVDRLLGQLRLDRSALQQPAGTAPPRRRASPWLVLGKGLAPLTIALCVINFFVSATTKVMVVWFPTILTESGIGITDAALAQAMFNFGCLIAMASAGWLVDRFGPLRIIVPALVLDAACVAALGRAGTHIPSVMIGAALVGAFIGIGGSGAQALASRVFPVEVRATGIGLGTSAARMGQVISPLAIAFMLSSGVGTRGVFSALALSPLIAALAVVAFVAVRRRIGVPQD